MARDGGGSWRPETLVAFGQPVTLQRDRVTALVAAELSAADARLFAIPPGADGTWRAADGRALVRIDALAPEARQRLETDHAAAAERIRQLADRLQQRGDAGRVAAHVLATALVTPTGIEARHTDGHRPVLAPWGQAMPGQDRPQWSEPTTLAAFPKTNGPAAAAAASPGLATATPMAVAASHRRRYGPLWLLWFLPAALAVFVAWLGWQLMQPLAPIIVEVAAPDEPSVADPTGALNDRIAELRRTLLAAEGVASEVAEACVVPPPVEVIEAPVPPPAAAIPAPTAEPPIAEQTPESSPPVAPPAATPRRPPVAQATPPRSIPSPPPPTAPPQAARPSPPPAASACTPNWPPGRKPRVIYVVDGSGSMQDRFPGAVSRMAAARDAVGRVTRALHQDIEVGMVAFSDCRAVQRTSFYSYAQRSAFLGQVNAITPQRMTSLAQSIARSGAAAPRTGDVMMVVVSDGMDTCGGDPCAAARQARASRPNLTINVIDLSDGEATAVLRCVASAGGGRVFTPVNAGEMNVQLQRATGHPDASACR